VFKRIDESYDKDSLQTPPYLFKFAESLLPNDRKFNIDLAASHDHHLCPTYITKKDNALNYNWSLNGAYGFCNPPYSRGMIDLFVLKAIKESRQGFTTIMVIPELNGEARTMNILGEADKIIHFNRRVMFINPMTGEALKNNNRGTIVVEFSGIRTSGDAIHECYNLKKIRRLFGDK